jgi:hypothetical protein
MRRFQRLALLAMLIGAGPAITGCADFDLDKLDVFGLNQKKPLPGERHAVFPEGVPGVTQGVPPELMLGNTQTQTQPGAAIPVEAIKPEEDANKTAAAQQAEEKAKPKAKPKPKKVAQTSRPKRINMAPQQQPASASAQPAAAAAASTAPAAQPTSAQQAWPAPAQSNAPWPDPPPSGTFSRQ